MCFFVRYPSPVHSLLRFLPSHSPSVMSIHPSHCFSHPSVTSRRILVECFVSRVIPNCCQCSIWNDKVQISMSLFHVFSLFLCFYCVFREGELMDITHLEIIVFVAKLMVELRPYGQKMSWPFLSDHSFTNGKIPLKAGICYLHVYWTMAWIWFGICSLSDLFVFLPW